MCRSRPKWLYNTGCVWAERFIHAHSLYRKIVDKKHNVFSPSEYVCYRAFIFMMKHSTVSYNYQYFWMFFITYSLYCYTLTMYCKFIQLVHSSNSFHQKVMYVTAIFHVALDLLFVVDLHFVSFNCFFTWILLFFSDQ